MTVDAECQSDMARVPCSLLIYYFRESLHGARIFSHLSFPRKRESMFIKLAPFLRGFPPSRERRFGGGGLGCGRPPALRSLSSTAPTADPSVRRIVEVSDSVVRRAGALAERHRLRAHDAVQLASAVDLRLAGGDCEFSSFDNRLNAAARLEHLATATR